MQYFTLDHTTIMNGVEVLTCNLSCGIQQRRRCVLVSFPVEFYRGGLLGAIRNYPFSIWQRLKREILRRAVLLHGPFLFYFSFILFRLYLVEGSNVHGLDEVLEGNNLLLDVVDAHQVVNDDSVDLELLDSISSRCQRNMCS